MRPDLTWINEVPRQNNDKEKTVFHRQQPMLPVVVGVGYRSRRFLSFSSGGRNEQLWIYF
jgi:hypothetical protein